MNKIILLGRLAKDPELKYGQTGTPVARFTLAVPRENDREKADFFFCMAFGKLAESLANYCQKGRQVLLEGRVEINTGTDQTGQQKTYINVIANNVEFLAKPGGSEPSGQHPDPGQKWGQPGQVEQQRFQPGPDGWMAPNGAPVY